MSRSAEMADYNRLVSDRPEKLTPEQASYIPARTNRTGYHCKECLHFFTNKAGRKKVCEIVRRPHEQPIEEEGVCKFWTHTGTKFPLYDRLDSE